MSTTQWILNIALLAWVLLRNLGTRPLDRSFVTVPLIVVAVAGGIYLRNIPTVGNDVFLDVVFAAAKARRIGNDARERFADRKITAGNGTCCDLERDACDFRRRRRTRAECSCRA